VSPKTSSDGSPRQRVARESARIGTETLARACLRLLLGGDADDDLVLVLGGAHAEALLAAEEDDPAQRYWLRVWAARGLLWCWDGAVGAVLSGAAGHALSVALDDEAWRVREMVLKVIARHRLDADLDKVAALQDDPVPRVRSAAHRALVSVTAV
jgi:hypothetical protein